MIQPGKQPVYCDKTGGSCVTCHEEIVPNRPHDLVRDCMPALDKRALFWARKRDAAAAVVAQVMRDEANSDRHSGGRPVRENPSLGLADGPAFTIERR